MPATLQEIVRFFAEQRVKSLSEQRRALLQQLAAVESERRAMLHLLGKEDKSEAPSRC